MHNNHNPINEQNQEQIGGVWVPVWKMIFDAADELRRKRIIQEQEMEIQDNTETEIGE